MKVNRSARMRQKQRWRPRLGDIVRRTIRKHLPAITANIAAHNALYRALLGRGAR
jgi:hypothetical protein